jgi:sec-independent protein translocase protein TatC
MLAEDVTITTPVITATGATTQTLTIPSGTRLPVTLVNTLPVVLNPTTLFSTYVKIALISGLALSLPMILYQLIIFLRGPKFAYASMSRKEFLDAVQGLSPEERSEAEQQRRDVYEGLTAEEIRPMYLFAPFALILFAAGVLFTYIVILPSALDFLFGIGGNLVQPLPSLDAYVDFALSLILWVGLAFELPLVMFFLARFGIVTASQFARQWRPAIVIIAVLAAVITPTVDALNMALVGLPLIGLYVLGILFAKLARPREKKALLPAPAPGGHR